MQNHRKCLTELIVVEILPSYNIDGAKKVYSENPTTVQNDCDKICVSNAGNSIVFQYGKPDIL